jgi:hypothetical protein
MTFHLWNQTTHYYLIQIQLGFVFFFFFLKKLTHYKSLQASSTIENL